MQIVAFVSAYHSDGCKSLTLSLDVESNRCSCGLERLLDELLALVPSSQPETPTYEEVWIVTEYKGGGIRGVFVSQGDAEAEIVAIRSEYPYLTRRDFIINIQRVRRGAFPVVQDEAPKANVEALLTGLAFAARDGRSRPLTERECDEILAALGASRPSPEPTFDQLLARAVDAPKLDTKNPEAVKAWAAKAAQSWIDAEEASPLDGKAVGPSPAPKEPT